MHELGLFFNLKYKTFGTVVSGVPSQLIYIQPETLGSCPTNVDYYGQCCQTWMVYLNISHL